MSNLRPWIKLVLAISLDGRIASPLDDVSHIGSTGDKRFLEEALAWSDATLMGGNTLRKHKSTCLIKSPKLIKKRTKKGLKEQPISIIISKGIDHNLKWPFFNQPLERWLLKPSNITESKVEPSNKNYGYKHKLNLAETWRETFQLLRGKGLYKIVLLGGAELADSILKEDQIDELQLTLCPKILGGEKTWIPTTNQKNLLALGKEEAWKLKEALPIEGSECIMRYLRNRAN